MRKLIVSGLVMGLLIGTANMGFSQEAKMEKKSPNTALLWSFLITGAGQIYNKETTKGLLMLGGKIVCVATMFEKETTKSTSGGGGVTVTMTMTETKVKTPQLIGAIGISVWSLIDAYKGANRFNEKYGIGLMFQENKPTLCVKYNF